MVKDKEEIFNKLYNKVSKKENKELCREIALYFFQLGYDLGVHNANVKIKS